MISSVFSSTGLPYALLTTLRLSSCSSQRSEKMAELPAPTPITEWPDYNANPYGGDVMTQDLNALYDKGDLCWLLVSSVLCW
jgi:hypothetical protein